MIQVREIFHVADEIVQKGIINGVGIVSVGQRLHQIAEQKLTDRLVNEGCLKPGQGATVKILQVQDLALETVHGAVWPYSSVTNVELAANNRCWTRFVAAKELAHVYMGFAPGYSSLNLLLTAALSARQTLPEHDNDLIKDEMFCFYLAMEILLPPGQIRKEAIDMRSSNKTSYEIAKRFLIPERIVTHFFDMGFLDRSRKFRGE